MREIDINDYDYELPQDRIAQHPLAERDASGLLIYNNGVMSKDTFKNLDEYLPADSLLVFNNSRVIRARIMFRKETGAIIEVFCLEPVSPGDYILSLSSTEPVVWKCIIGNLKKWKSGKISTSSQKNGNSFELVAEKIKPEGDAWWIRFTWNKAELNFGEVIEQTGHIPLPPYIEREDEIEDVTRYQTVYSRINGSVAAPTAGLHFTENVFDRLRKKKIRSAEITLHVGAGTFQPVKSRYISGHQMHCEHFFVTADTLKLIKECKGRIIPVGTTSLRTIESLYWLGVKIINSKQEPGKSLILEQWEAYSGTTDISSEESIDALLDYIKTRKLRVLHASTSIIILPGYVFRLSNGLITNFHQPRSTLLLLVSAWTGEKWKEIYNYALGNGFRFLSYGDSSLLLR